MKEKIIKHIKSYSILERILLIFSIIALNFDLFYLRSLKDVLAYFKETFLLLFNNDYDIYDAIPGFYPFFALITASILLGISVFIKKSKARLVIIIINFLISSTYFIVCLFLFLFSLSGMSG